MVSVYDSSYCNNKIMIMNKSPLQLHQDAYIVLKFFDTHIDLAIQWKIYNLIKR